MVAGRVFAGQRTSHSDMGTGGINGKETNGGHACMRHLRCIRNGKRISRSVHDTLHQERGRGEEPGASGNGHWGAHRRDAPHASVACSDVGWGRSWPVFKITCRQENG